MKGIALGHIGTVGGELCFNTGMTGYQEILTDPSYKGQIINMTYPHIGNYGINKENIESNNIYCSGFIAKDACEFPSNYKSEISINEYLKKNKIVAIQNIDTRMITKIIRCKGAMNAIISSNYIDKKELFNCLIKTPKMKGLDLASLVSCKKAYFFDSPKIEKYKIAALDFGIKTNILRILSDYNCKVKVFPANTSKKEILEYNPDGIFLSNGPGDPSACYKAIKTVKSLLGIKPIFGICLGHQILALALGAKTFKMKFGHRGCNHPVKNLKKQTIEITSQNHGFSISEKNLPKDVEITHINLNDNTIEGIISKKHSAFSVQHHPESSPGPHDANYLFKDFIKLIKKNA